MSGVILLAPCAVMACTARTLPLSLPLPVLPLRKLVICHVSHIVDGQLKGRTRSGVTWRDVHTTCHEHASIRSQVFGLGCRKNDNEYAIGLMATFLVLSKIR